MNKCYTNEMNKCYTEDYYLTYTIIPGLIQKAIVFLDHILVSDTKNIN